METNAKLDDVQEINKPRVYDSEGILSVPPAMWINEICYIKNVLLELSRKNDFLNILEWGSGNSTIHFSKFLKERMIGFKWVAMEHFLPWYNEVVDLIKEHDFGANVEYFLKNPTDEPDKVIQETLNLSEYINFPVLLNRKFNLIIVDGRKRQECLKLASTILAPGGIVILHDAERPEYHDGFRFYLHGGDFVISNISPVSRGGIQKLWIGGID